MSRNVSGSRIAVLTLPTKYWGPIFLPMFIPQIFVVTLLFPQLLVLIVSNSNPPGNKTPQRRRNDVSLYVPVTSQVRLK